MQFRSLSIFVACALFVLGGDPSFAQSSAAKDKLAKQAQQEYRAKNFAEAERDFRELTVRHPSNIYMQIYFGQTLFEQQKFAESLRPFEKAYDLERAGNKLTSDQHRILVDQLVMAYGMSGDLKKARALLDGAIQQDPEYPLNYYNLACAFAEEGNKNKALANLSLAFQHKDNVLKGEKMPDPRTDSSFQKYVRDDDFIVLMKKLGYQLTWALGGWPTLLPTLALTSRVRHPFALCAKGWVPTASFRLPKVEIFAASPSIHTLKSNRVDPRQISQDRLGLCDLTRVGRGYRVVCDNGHTHPFAQNAKG